jgi:uncharacterized phage protein (TIGR01671 family)
MSVHDEKTRQTCEYCGENVPYGGYVGCPTKCPLHKKRASRPIVKLKFRYYDTVLKRFVRSDEYRISDRLAQLSEFFTNAETYADGEVQQFTGLVDCNGEDIYDGDIVTENVDHEGREPCSPTIPGVETGEVFWNTEKHCWGLKKVDDFTGYLTDESMAWFDSGRRYRVAGNIFETTLVKMSKKKK